jgi:hypothetical protein
MRALQRQQAESNNISLIMLSCGVDIISGMEMKRRLPGARLGLLIGVRW